MNRIPFLHYFKDEQDIFKSYFLALIPLLLFGFYKNGILLYQNGLIQEIEIFRPLYFVVVSLGVGFAVAKIMRDEVKNNLLLSLIVMASMSLNTNLLIYAILLFVLLFIVRFIQLKVKFSFNEGAIIRLFLVLSLIINAYSYFNIAEKLDKFNYDLFDVFLGFGVGGMFSTSFLAICISMVILACNKYYKKIIPLMAIFAFFLVSTIYMVISKNYDYLSFLFNGTVYFAFVFMGADKNVSPYTKKGMAIYGFLMGLGVGVLAIFWRFEGVFLGIFLVSLLIPLINNFSNKKYLRD